MKVQHHDLVALREQMLSSSPTLVCGPCPSVDEIQAAVAGETSAKVQREIALHCARCPACFEDWTVARNFQAAVQNEVTSLTSKRPSTRREVFYPRKKQRLRGLGFLALAACAGLFFWSRDTREATESPSQTQIRGRNTPMAQPVIHASFEDGRFSWELGLPVESFELVIYDVKLQELARRSGLQVYSVTFDEVMSKSLNRTSPIYWQVLANGKSGQVYRSSPQLEHLKVVRQ